MLCHGCGKDISDRNALYCPDCGEALSHAENSDACICREEYPYDISKVWPAWRLEKLLGKGAFGSVYKAVRCDGLFESRAAIKIISIPADKSEIDSLRSEGFTKESTRKYFKTVVDEFIGEIVVMESLKGLSNIVSVEDYTVIEKDDDIGWDIYIRMELLTPFTETLENKSLTQDEVISLGCDICTALEFCTRKKIIHRDIKPENIFVDKFGGYKLGDFGIAKKLENVTGAMSRKGTFNYMAPEVARSTDYDARVDTYSLGVVLYKLLNGNRLPFIDTEEQQTSHSARRTAVERRISGDKLTPPENASPDMQDFVLRACEFDPDKRFKDATQMKNALISIRKGRYNEFLISQGLKEPEQKIINEEKSSEQTKVADTDRRINISDYKSECVINESVINEMPERYNNNSDGLSAECIVPPEDEASGNGISKGLIAVIAVLAVCVIAVSGIILSIVFHDEDKPVEVQAQTPAISDISVGIILLRDENYNYDKSFITGAQEVIKALGLKDSQIIIKTNIREDNQCFDAAKELADEGCDIIIGTSPGYESFLVDAAKEYKQVQFCQINGKLAHTKKLDNFHNAYAEIHNARYVTGVGAGMKLNEMIEEGKLTSQQAKLGFVASYPFEEVISAYSAFYLGAKSVCRSVTMDVYFTSSWYDENSEMAAAGSLIARGCKIISQYSDSPGSINACEKAGIPNVAYNLDKTEISPACCMISSEINWAPYLKYVIESVVGGEQMATDFCGSFTDGTVSISLDEKMLPAGAEDRFEEIINLLETGALHVFDISTFTSGGKVIKEYYADVHEDDKVNGDTQVISDGYFKESEYRSAPYFDIRVDGINLLNE